MPFSEFEEKQYESAANIEQALQKTAVFAVGQILESIVGYDAATQPPKNSPIWKLMGVGAPKGLQLSPNLWQKAKAKPKAPELPSSYVSLILQYKRPQYLTTARAQQWSHWNAPYYRFSIASGQQQILEKLEVSTTGSALVRYACPAYWTYTDLQTRQQKQTVLPGSMFVEPHKLTGHTVWTYDKPGIHGWANSQGVEVPTETFGEFNSKARRVSNRPKINLFEHVNNLASEVVPELNAQDSPEWLSELTNTFELNGREQATTYNLVQLADQLGSAGLTWFVADFNTANA